MNCKILIAAATLGSGVFFLTGQEPAPAGIYTLAQAEAGRLASERTCSKCHTPTLLGRKGEAGELPALTSLSNDYQKFIGPRGWVPPLVGKTFVDRWGSKTAAELVARFQETVSYFTPEAVSDETTVNITAYVLQLNGAKAGTQPLTRTTSTVVRSVTH